MQIDKAMLTAYQDRWQMVADTEAIEQRQTSVAQRWQKLNSLVRMATSLGLLQEEDDVQATTVRNRWLLLKQQYVEQFAELLEMPELLTELDKMFQAK